MFKNDKAKEKMDKKHKESTDNIADETVNSTNEAEISTEENITGNQKTAANTSSQQEETPQANADNQWQVQFEEMKDKYLRLSAEFDNYRKRTLKEKMELAKSGGEDVLKGLLPVMDDFERGLKHVDEAADVQALKDGLFLIYNKFKDFLAQKGIKEIETSNCTFDTDLHEAITKIPMPEMSGKVVDVMEKGYMLNDKVIRFAKVVVGE